MSLDNDSRVFAQVCGVSYSYEGGAEVLGGLNCSLERGLIGLVGPNGCGKSTLLRLIAGELEPASGNILRTGEAAFLPQNIWNFSGSVEEALGVATPLSALRRIAAGEILPELLAVADGNWDLAERVDIAMSRLGVGHIPLSRDFATLSGGEAVKTRLAALLLNAPDILLLDEPTNNLDRDGRKALLEFLSSWEGCALIASHDRELLSIVDRIFELSNRGLAVYGGDYGFYREARAGEDTALEQTIGSARHELKREKLRRQAHLESQAHRMAAGNKRAEKGGIPKIIAGGHKRRAQQSLGKAKKVHDGVVAGVEDRLRRARALVRESNVINVDLPLTEVPNGKLLVECVGLKFSYEGTGRAMFGEGLDFSLSGPERVAVSGPNGCGKSTLLRLISSAAGAGEPPQGKISGRLFVAAGCAAYLDQRIEFLDDNLTLLENINRFAPELKESEKRLRLARFLFREELALRPARALSGGQRLHAALACLLSSPNPPLLLLLDEPTNNLDLDSVQKLESALSNYRGALLAVSHDESFLENIGVSRRLELPG